MKIVCLSDAQFEAVYNKLQPQHRLVWEIPARHILWYPKAILFIAARDIAGGYLDGRHLGEQVSLADLGRFAEGKDEA